MDTKIAVLKDKGYEKSFIIMNGGFRPWTL